MTEHRPPVKPIDRLLLNSHSVARILDISEDTARRMMADGRLPSVEVEGLTRRLVPYQSLYEWTRKLIREQVERSEPT